MPNMKLTFCASRSRCFAGSGIALQSTQRAIELTDQRADLALPIRRHHVFGINTSGLRLYLYQFTRLSRRSGDDDQIAPLRCSVALCHLTNWPDRVDDSRAGGICHKSGEGLGSTPH